MATIAIGISPKAGGGYTTKVPVNSLEEDGVPPEEGDSVSFSVEGKVQSVEGNEATVSIDSINGEPVGEEASESPEEEAGEEGQEGQGGGTPPTPTSGASPRTSMDMAPMGPARPAKIPPPAPISSRIDRKGTNLMRNRLLKGARGKAFPF